MNENEPDFVNVSIRIKPNLNNVGTEDSSCLKIITKQPPVLFVIDRAQTYHFDNIFTEEINQATVYDETVKPLVEYVKQGYNCTVFAYGQTGTGKTYTVGTNLHVTSEEQLGLIPRTLNQFFDYSVEDDIEIEISLSFIEIYNEKVFDLLQNDYNKQRLLIKGLKLEGFCQERVFNLTEAKHFLEIGNRNRHTAGTKQNANSSRSHAIFTIYCKTKHRDSETIAKLNLVDLAGCESVKKTGNQGSTFQEGVNINKGLLCIGQVMTALSTNSSYIPYRQSVITSVLQDSLNKKNFVSLIACVSSQLEDTTETVQTLDFAYRVKKVKSKPEVNEVISHFKKINPMCFTNTRTGITPFKKPLSMCQTPIPTKKPKLLLPPTLINEPSVDCISELSHSSESFATCSSASSLCNIDLSQQALSPVLKKYMSAMESMLMDKIELVIKSTLKTPGVQSFLSKTSDKENTVGTPSVGLNTIQNEVLKLRQELAQFTAQRTRAASSPIEDNFHKVRKVLSYNSSPENNISETDKICGDKSVTDDNFKIPKIPIRKRTPSVSPIAPRRCSIRLSLKKVHKNDTLQQSDISLENSYVSVTNATTRLKSISKDTKKSSSNDCDNFKRRRSTRLAFKCNNNTINYDSNDNLDKPKDEKFKKLEMSNTPIGQRLLDRNMKDSPHTAHTKHVLHVLNTGSLKEIVQLHTIGVKTSQQIMLNRKLKGHLNKISDMMEMPGWSDKKYERFIEQNFIKKELL